MTVPAPPAHQKRLQAAMEQAWKRLDALDHKAEVAMRARVTELRARIIDQLTDIPTMTGPDGRQTFQVWSLEQYRTELTMLLERWEQDTFLAVSRELGESVALSQFSHQGALAALATGSSGVVPPELAYSSLGLSEDQVRAAMAYTSSQIQGVKASAVSLVNEQIQAVVFGGQSRWEAIRQIRAALGTDPKNLGKLTTSAIRIERTALMSVFNIVAEQAYRQAAKSLPGLMSEWMTAGSRVCTRCLPLNGMRKKPGETFPGGVIAPPLHFNCRCRTVAWLPEWA